MQVSEGYLACLERDSRNLMHCEPAEVKRSRTYDMKEPLHRIALAQLAARISLEGLYQYTRHRGKRSGLVKRLCTAQPEREKNK